MVSLKLAGIKPFILCFGLPTTAEKLRKKWEEEEEERKRQTPVYVEPKSKTFLDISSNYLLKGLKE